MIIYLSSAFKNKRNRVLRASLVACGYSQVPGVDSKESFSSVINDIRLRVLFHAKLVRGMILAVIGAEITFLNGELNEETYIKIPKGLFIP
jgi:Reverse transcriptase (RNA-dependent DNA polymerase)